MDVLFKAIFCFFAIYGVIQMTINIYGAINNISFNETEDIHIVISVKNQQDSIEGIIRSLVWKSLNNQYGGIVPKILVVDLGSTDQTVDIIKKLVKEYDFIELETDKKE